MGHILGLLFFAILAIIIIGALAQPVANLTMGTTGFNTSANITSTSGLTPILQAFPIFFVIIGFLIVIRMLNPDSMFEGETEEHPYPPSQPKLEPESQPEPVTENCKNCGGPNVDRVT